MVAFATDHLSYSPRAIRPTNIEDDGPQVQRANVDVEPTVITLKEVGPVWVCNHAQAHALGVALHALKFTTLVYTSDSFQAYPMVWVKRRDQELFIYLGPGDDDQWWFWSPKLEPIALSTEVSKAADAIVRAFDTAAAEAMKTQLSPIG